MARIAGVDLPREKKIQYALPYIFGIGPSNAKKILAETGVRSEEHTSELQSRLHLVCRLLLEKKKKTYQNTTTPRRKLYTRDPRTAEIRRPSLSHDRLSQPQAREHRPSV